MNRCPAPRDGFERLRLVHPPAAIGDALFVAETNGEVAALTRDGAELWRRRKLDARHPIAAQVALTALGQRLLLRVDDRLSELDPRDGSQRWSADFPADPVRDHFDGRCLWGFQMATGTSTHVEHRALDVATGEVAISLPRSRPGRVLDASDELVVVCEDRTHLVGITLDDGSDGWSTVVERKSGRLDGKPAALAIQAFRHDELVIVPVVEYGFVAISRADGRVAWDVDVSSSARALLVGGRLHVWATWRVLELIANDGTITSDVSITDPDMRRHSGTLGSLTYDDGVLYGVNLDGTVVGWNVRERALVWTHHVGARVEWSCRPQVMLGALWVMDAGGKLHSFDLA